MQKNKTMLVYEIQAVKKLNKGYYGLIGNGGMKDSELQPVDFVLTKRNLAMLRDQSQGGVSTLLDRAVKGEFPASRLIDAKRGKGNRMLTGSWIILKKAFTRRYPGYLLSGCFATTQRMRELLTFSPNLLVHFLDLRQGYISYLESYEMTGDEDEARSIAGLTDELEFMFAHINYTDPDCIKETSMFFKRVQELVGTSL